MLVSHRARSARPDKIRKPPTRTRLWRCHRTQCIELQRLQSSRLRAPGWETHWTGLEENMCWECWEQTGVRRTSMQRKPAGGLRVARSSPGRTMCAGMERARQRQWLGMALALGLRLGRSGTEASAVTGERAAPSCRGRKGRSGVGLSAHRGGRGRTKNFKTTTVPLLR
jgi:hypothetical protein